MSVKYHNKLYLTVRTVPKPNRQIVKTAVENLTEHYNTDDISSYPYMYNFKIRSNDNRSTFSREKNSKKCNFIDQYF